MIEYSIKHHIPGRIRIEVPLLKDLSLPDLQKLFHLLSTFPVPLGIKGMRPNPLSCSLVIEYDPKLIDIHEYIRKVASSREMAKVFGIL
ncbi:MAG: hypothetical protein K8I29_19910 [Alphaproteobacteria bacterium]|uniref:Uncharacterized protein n=1 Tax=Candidatus Nitrobium versatile TaxID=2884831 RepID=A0A953SE09_9BACT|nr:hypothetical protein [Candidatus Nitrobium versatile]